MENNKSQNVPDCCKPKGSSGMKGEMLFEPMLHPKTIIFPGTINAANSADSQRNVVFEQMGDLTSLTLDVSIPCSRHANLRISEIKKLGV